MNFIKKHKCAYCGKSEYEFSLFPIKGIDGTTVFVCTHCVNTGDKVAWCSYCGEPFELQPGDKIEDTLYCYDCQDMRVANGFNERNV